ncbi:hypothetical protein [Streptomyces sp. NPDC020965]|uniref:hypothetical protein n=1 Tax=Streptomyces sp. NPDC020965 TaxID=3365105 RepID=UPI0037BD8667
MDSTRLYDEEQRDAVIETYGTTELPVSLVKVRAKTRGTFPGAASVTVSTWTTAA